MTFSTQGSPSRPTRSSRYLWWLLGIGGAAVLVVLLCLLLLPALVTLIWASQVDEIEQRDIDQQRQSATKVLARLQAAAADGDLTDAEVAEAVGKLWPVERTAAEIRVPTGYHAEAIGCYLVVLTLPLGPDTKSSLVEASCPTEPATLPPTA